MKPKESKVEIKTDRKTLEKAFNLFTKSLGHSGWVKSEKLELENEEAEFVMLDDHILFRYDDSSKKEIIKSFIEFLESYKTYPELLFFGATKELSHPIARKLITQEEFWSGSELAPFGSDEGSEALCCYRNWRLENNNETVYLFLVLSCLTGDSWHFNLRDYLDKKVLDKNLVKKHVNDDKFNCNYNYFTLDTTIIATCFGQFIDEGIIEESLHPILEVSIDKLILWSEVKKDWKYAEEYISRLNILKTILARIKAIK